MTGLSLLAIAGLGTIVAYELTGGVALAPQVTAAAPPSALPEAAPEPSEFRPPPPRQFNEISARPLFFPSRRPFAAPAAGGTAPALVAEPAAALELIGVLLTDHERAALLQPAGQPGAQWVREQQTVAGWLVEEIAPDRVRLREGDRVEVVELRDDQEREPVKRKRMGKRARAAAKDKTAEKAE
ncbi:MAG TPA: hypothetical protein VLE23_11405 [Geminicoccaceae bacterium]|nr:hypothetical protein [Geminicoccaceae bacterium]